MRRAAILFLTACSMAGCLTPTGAVMTDVPVSGWRDEAVVRIDNRDTLTERDLFLLLRRNARFTCDSLCLSVSVFSPDSLRFDERRTFPVLRTRRAASVRDVVRIPYRLRAVLPHAGEYRFVFTPSEPVSGIEAVGIDIVKSE